MRTKATATTTLVLLALATFAAASPTKFPIGTTRFDADRVSPGWVLFTASNGVTYVIDPAGQPIHSWVTPDPSAAGILGSEPLLDQPGHVLASLNNPVIPGCDVDCGKVVEMDWDGNVVWEYVDTTRSLHHDLERLDNGNTLFMCSKTLFRPEIAPVEIVDDCVIEVAPDGTVVWEWQTADHYDELALTDEERQLIFENAEANRGDWAHGNSIDSISENTPHVDPRFRPGNVIVSFRHINLVVIIDRDTDEIVWQSRASIGQHHAHMIENGLEGAGLVMVFDNGHGGQYPPIARMNSRVIEIDPITEQIVREYAATATGLAHWTFFTGFAGFAQRQPNGNIMITEAMFGRAFEIAPDASMVWEFVSPIFVVNAGFFTNQVSRYYKVPVDWVGPFGQSLSWPESEVSGAQVRAAPGARPTR